jgi:hypothetical protein
MPFPGQDAASKLQTARDGAARYLAENLGNMGPEQQNAFNEAITQLDLAIQTITMGEVVDALDPAGHLFKQVSDATQQAAARLDSLARTQQTIVKAFHIATTVLGLATAIATGNVLSIGAAIVDVNSAASGS